VHQLREQMVQHLGDLRVGVLYLALHHRIFRAVLRDVSVELEHRPLLVISSMDTLKKKLLELVGIFTVLLYGLVCVA
jgi:hypothetical protein